MTIVCAAWIQVGASHLTRWERLRMLLTQRTCLQHTITGERIWR